MSNLQDYLSWRGDLSWTQSQMGDVDAAIFAVLSYLDPGSVASTTEGIPVSALPEILSATKPINKFDEERRGLAALAAMQPRTRDIRVCRYIAHTDVEAAVQFSAMTFALPEGGQVIAYRGTDSTLVGWREDFTMSYESPVPAQKAAVAYLEAVAAASDGPIWLTGHSKGGNLAAYAAIHAADDVQARLAGVWSLDGPGLDDESMASDRYQALAGRMHSLIPKASIVGLLMNYHPVYRIVDADSAGIFQHDPFTWHVMGPAFETVETNTFSSQLIDETLHQWLRTCTPEQRRLFVDTLFDIVYASNATTTAEVRKDPLRALAGMGQAVAKQDPEIRKAFLELAGRFVTLGATSAFNLTIGREANNLAEQAQAFLRGLGFQGGESDHEGE